MSYPRSVYRVFDRMQAKRQGHRSWPATFADRLTHPVPDSRAVRRLMLSGGMRPDVSDAGRIPVRPAGALPEVPDTDVAVLWAGHASCVLRIGGLVVLTDPVWSTKISGVRPRLTAPGLPWSQLPPVDAVVISHNHFDHLDAPTVKRLPRDTPVLVPGGLGWWFRRLGFRRVTELDWWETADIGPVRFQFTPAHHWSRRTLFDTCRSLWGGWVITAHPQTPGATTVYFAGDSAYGPCFAEIGARNPRIDLALLPVGAYLPRWFMKPLHMSPDEAVRACADLGAPRMMTMHWGTFVLSMETPMEPVEQSRTAWRAAGRDPRDLWDLAVGEARTLQRAPSEG